MLTVRAILQLLLSACLPMMVCSQQNSSLIESPAGKNPGRDASLIREDIFIHTDRDEYVAGENLWYAAYVVNRQDTEPGIASRTAYIEILNSNNIPVMQKTISIADGSGNGVFLIPDTLSSGAYILRAYTNLMKNFPPDQCFMKCIFIYNTFGNNKFRIVSAYGRQPVPGLIFITAFKNSRNANFISGNPEEKIRIEAPATVKQREKVTVGIYLDKSLVSGDMKPNLSISVSPETNWGDSMEISGYLSAVRSEASDQASAGRSGIRDYMNKTEEEGRYLSGRIINKNQKNSRENMVVLLSIPGKEAFFQYAIADKEGNFSFYIENDSLQKDLVIQVAGNPDDDLIRLNSPYWESYAAFNEVSENSLFEIPPYIREWSVNYQVGRVYGIKSMMVQVTPDRAFKIPFRFYGTPEFELKMADYILLPDMREVFFELVPGVSLKTGRTGNSITVSNPRDNKVYESDATLMIDGIIISDPSLIAGMNTEIVERIEVMRTEYIAGGYHFYGIVNVITKEGNFNSLDLPKNAVRLPYRTYDPEIRFILPEYSSSGAKESRVPDYRNTLYWNPKVEPDPEGKARVEFWSSDFRSDFEINIQGMTADGKPFSAKKILRVE